MKRKINWLPVVCGALVFTLALSWAAAGPGGFVYTGNMYASGQNTATLLEDGTVLVAGGGGAGPYLSTAELYNPVAGIFSTTGSMTVPRGGQTATLLDNGMVLIAGGINNVTGTLASAEVYNPATATFSATGNMNAARVGATATLLGSGVVLVAGGVSSTGSILATAELYNPATETFSFTGSMTTVRSDATATLLDSGLVLIVGGVGNGGGSLGLASAELYNPETGTFSSTGSMNHVSYTHTATLLNNGMVLVAGGDSNSGTGAIATAELYNPATGAFSVTGSMTTPRRDQAATLLNDGMVLIAGGHGLVSFSYPYGFLASAELYNPASGTFSSTGGMNTARMGLMTTLLQNGSVLATGGWNSSGNTASAEVYQPTLLTPPGLLSITVSPGEPYVALGNFRNLTAKGVFGSGDETLASVTWSSSNAAIATVSNDASNHGNTYAVSAGTTTISACAGSVCGSTTLTVAPHTSLLLGSESGDSSSGTFESYDDSGNRLETGNLSVSRSLHSGTLLSNGTLFVAGGVNSQGSWQILDVHGNVLNSGSLLNGFYQHLAVLSGNGNVFLIGGAVAPGSWEIRDPNGVLVGSGSLLGKRTFGAGAVLLKNGNVWIAASGAGFLSDECTWEIHGPTGALLSNGTLNTCFASGKQFVLSNGNVVLLGGVNAPGAYEIRTQTGAYVRSGTLRNGFDNASGAVQVSPNNIMLFEQGFWEYIGFDSNGNTVFDSTGSLLDSRVSARGVLLSTGDILITGGNTAPATWEMYTPNGTTLSLHTYGNLFDTRYGGHTATHF